MDGNQEKDELSTLYNAYSKLRLVGGEKDDDAVRTVLEFARTEQNDARIVALVTAILSQVGADYRQYAVPISTFLLKVLLDRQGSVPLRVEALSGLQKLSKANTREILSQSNAGVTSFVKALLEDFDGDLNVKYGAVVSLEMSPNAVLNVLYGALTGQSHLKTNAGKMLSFYLQHPLLAKGIDGIDSVIEKGFMRDRTLLGDVLEDAEASRGEMLRWLKKLIEISDDSLDKTTVEKIRNTLNRSTLLESYMVQNGHSEAHKQASPVPHTVNDGSDVEEGELVDAVQEDGAALVDVDSIVPKVIYQGLQLSKVPKQVESEGQLRDIVESIAAVDKVYIRDGTATVTFPSIPAAVKGFEALSSGGANIWRDTKVVEDSLVTFMDKDYDDHFKEAHLWMEKIETVEQEDQIREKMRKGKISLKSFVSVAGVAPGLILSFPSASELQKAFVCLGGKGDVVPKKRQRGEESSDAVKKSKVDKKGSHRNGQMVWDGKIARNKQIQCVAKVSDIDISVDGSKWDTEMKEPYYWPPVLDVNQRMDVRYLFDTLFPSCDPKSKRLVAIEVPSSSSAENNKGLEGLDGYLRGKNRAGVVFLPNIDGFKQRTLYLVPINEESCNKLHVDAHKFRKRPAMIGVVIGTQ
eukprot:jgi/Picsp_1/2288/NSC_05752-R1_ubiquitin system component cue domain-containing